MYLRTAVNQQNDNIKNQTPLNFAILKFANLRHCHTERAFGHLK